MTKALSYLLFACILIGACAAHSKLWDEIESLEQKVAHTIGAIDGKLMEPAGKRSYVLCACENKDCQKTTTTPEELSLPVIKSITDKIEKILSKDVFRNIVKRSVVDDEEKEQDAKDEVKSMLSIYENIKKIFGLNDQKDVAEFRARLMSLPEDKPMSLKDMIQQIKSADAAKPKVEKIQITKSSTTKSSMIQIIEKAGAARCDEQTKRIECPSAHKISIMEATVSNKDQAKCSAFQLKPRSHDNDDESSNVCTEEMITTHLVSKSCDGKQSCELSLQNELSKVCECAVNKYLDVEYICVPEQAASRVRRAAKGGKGGKGGKGKGKGKGKGQGKGKQTGGYGATGQSYGGASKPSYGGASKPSYGKGYGKTKTQTQTYSKPEQPASYGTPYTYSKNKPQKILTIAPRRFMPIPFPIPAPIGAPVAPVAAAAAPVVAPQAPRSATVLTIQPTYQQEQPTYHEQQPRY